MSAFAIGLPLALYVVLVLSVGLYVGRRAGRSPEEYYLAGRTLGPVVLFMALFGTNCTAFVLVGIPGRAYHDGVGVFSVNAPIIALAIPLTFWAIGVPARRAAQELGALTPAELYAKKLASPALGLLMFFFYLLYTVPYMVTAVKGAAVTLSGVSGGAVPLWLGAAGTLLVALTYTALGGMRATAWTNVVQGTLFLVFMVLAFVFAAQSLGGPEAATQSVLQHDKSLLQIKDGPLYTAQGFSSWGLAISLTVIGFPHMLVRLMAGASESAIKQVCRWYPVALILLWIPAVLLGVWGAAAFPGLDGRASDRIFSLMSSQHLPVGLASLGFVAVLAAVMSTLDAQLLTLSSMLARDVVARVSPKADPVKWGRLFSLVLAAVVLVLAVTWGSSVFDIASIAFSGYVTLVPVLFFGLWWPRTSSMAAIASIICANGVLILGVQKMIPLGGFLPVFWAFITGVVVLIAGSLAAPARQPAIV